MMVEWIKFVNALGKGDDSYDFLELCQAIGESAKVTSDPDEYSDPVGKTKYFKFSHSGIEIGFRQGVLNHIHFYFSEEDGYSPFSGSLLFGINSNSSREMIIKNLGEPSSSGGGKMDTLIGYINQWIKYELTEYSLHLQFSQNGSIHRATLLK
ncbi:hypothetical protein RF240_20860 [Dickeya dadantii]|uniref:hypothetical protein n=1 Tax=Dickeya dadantii TaxID=204038 RepID=UPI0035A8CCE5